MAGVEGGFSSAVSTGAVEGGFAVSAAVSPVSSLSPEVATSAFPSPTFAVERASEVAIATWSASEAENLGSGTYSVAEQTDLSSDEAVASEVVRLAEGLNPGLAKRVAEKYLGLDNTNESAELGTRGELVATQDLVGDEVHEGEANKREVVEEVEETGELTDELEEKKEVPPIDERERHHEQNSFIKSWRVEDALKHARAFLVSFLVRSIGDPAKVSVQYQAQAPKSPALEEAGITGDDGGVIAASNELSTNHVTTVAAAVTIVNRHEPIAWRDYGQAAPLSALEELGIRRNRFGVGVV